MPGYRPKWTNTGFIMKRGVMNRFKSNRTGLLKKVGEDKNSIGNFDIQGAAIQNMTGILIP